MTHTCKNCGYSTDRLDAFKRHQNRKNPCKTLPKKYIVLDPTKPFISSLVDAMFKTSIMEDFIKEHRNEIVEAIKLNPAFLDILRSKGIIPEDRNRGIEKAPE